MVPVLLLVLVSDQLTSPLPSARPLHFPLSPPSASRHASPSSPHLSRAPFSPLACAHPLPNTVNNSPPHPILPPLAYTCPSVSQPTPWRHHFRATAVERRCKAPPTVLNYNPDFAYCSASPTSAKQTKPALDTRHSTLSLARLLSPTLLLYPHTVQYLPTTPPQYFSPKQAMYLWLRKYRGRTFHRPSFPLPPLPSHPLPFPFHLPHNSTPPLPPPLFPCIHIPPTAHRHVSTIGSTLI